MTDLDRLLLTLLCDRTVRGPVWVLRGPEAETLTRWREGRHLERAQFARGQNTWEEAQVAIAELVEQDVTVVTSGYHVLRAFLTWLWALQAVNWDRTVRLWMHPVMDGWDALATEEAKMRDYQAKGHVASVAQGLSYLAWRDAP